MYRVSSNSGSGSDGARDGQPDGVRAGTIRLLTLNLGLLGFGLHGRWRVPLDSELRQRLAAAPYLLSTVDADIIALQEVYTPADRAFLTDAMAARYPFHAGSPNSGSFVGNGLMLLSRFPILHSEFMPCDGAPRWTRLFWKQGLLSVVLDLPVIGRTRLINVHLATTVPFGDAGSSSSAANRNREVVQ